MSFSALSSTVPDTRARAGAPRGRPARPQGTDTARLVSLLAGLAALAVAVLLPAAYLITAQGRVGGSLETSALLQAAELAELARQAARLPQADTMPLPAPDSRVERWRVFDPNGRLVMETSGAEALAWPVLVRRVPIRGPAARLGEVEAARSIRPELGIAAAVALGAGLLGAAIFAVLRILPVRLLRHALDRAAYLSAHDLLTGLPNRTLFADRLRQAVAQSRRAGQPLAVLCLDLDRFKEVNDALGHAGGDRLLCEATQRLSGCLRESDTLARLGGNEFAVIQPRASRPQDAEALARRIIAAIAAPFAIDGQRVTIGVSVGIALSQPGQAIDPLQLLKDADLALFQAKGRRRGDLCFFSPEMNRRLTERRALETDLRIALSEGQFRLHYQPQVDLPSSRVIGAEALLRWDRPGHGNVPPGQFIPLAEETGLVAGIGAWTLREACREASTWPDGLTVAVNVSAVQFRFPGLFETVAAALADSGLAPQRLELEITEGVLLQDNGETLAVLERLRGLGVKIAMDDFGTGYSSLGYLQKFVFDKIKIDRSFISSLGQDPNSDAIVRAVVGISRSLGVRANAEGVESAEQARMLMREGCGEVQGYLFGRPMPPEEFSRFVAARQAA